MERASSIVDRFAQGAVIPAHPLALTQRRTLDERRQRALSRYYLHAGAGGIAVGVHTTQFGIRDPAVGLFEPVLALAMDEMRSFERATGKCLLRIGGICGRTMLAVREAELLSRLGYDAGLLSLAAMKDSTEDELIAHCTAVALVHPVIGFYLQSAVGGRNLSYAFWRRFAEIPNVVAIKVAPFNRYDTLNVLRAVGESGRAIPIYTGNDDNIVLDLITPYPAGRGEKRMVGGLLGHWAVWTKKAVSLLAECGAAGSSIPDALLRRSVEVTDCNAAFFDAAHGFAGCIAGLHEVLRRQGLLEGTWCLDPDEGLSPGQAEEIDRVYKAYPHLNDDCFVKENLDCWLRP